MSAMRVSERVGRVLPDGFEVMKVLRLPNEATKTDRDRQNLPLGGGCVASDGRPVDAGVRSVRLKSDNEGFVLRRKVRVGAGRTDTGVNARGQVAEPHRAAVLAALQITDELFRTRRELTEYSGGVLERVTALKERVGSVVNDETARLRRFGFYGSGGQVPASSRIRHARHPTSRVSFRPRASRVEPLSPCWSKEPTSSSVSGRRCCGSHRVSWSAMVTSPVTSASPGRHARWVAPSAATPSPISSPVTG